MEPPEKRYVIIVAGGNGSRMNSPVPKQFLRLEGRPILMHTISKFTDTDAGIEVIIVIPPDQVSLWESLCAEHNFYKTAKIAFSGESRFHSVKNGLALVTEPGIVGVHDAVRPLVSSKTIIAAYKAAGMYGNAIPAVPINDSIRQIETTRNIALDRSRYCAIQTPQCFRSDILKKAYEQEYRYTFTDDATVVEALGEQIRLVDGNTENLKITSPKDIFVAEALLKAENQSFISPKI